jgi:hypothetical protein
MGFLILFANTNHDIQAQQKYSQIVKNRPAAGASVWEDEVSGVAETDVDSAMGVAVFIFINTY